jgi:hypothetical protein
MGCEERARLRLVVVAVGSKNAGKMQLAARDAFLLLSPP